MKLSEMGDEKTAGLGANANEKILESEKVDSSRVQDFASLSHEDLLQRLFQEVNAQKSRGVFDYDGLRQTLQQVRPYVGEAAFANMLDLLEKFK